MTVAYWRTRHQGLPTLQRRCRFGVRVPLHHNRYGIILSITCHYFLHHKAIWELTLIQTVSRLLSYVTMVVVRAWLPTGTTTEMSTKRHVNDQTIVRPQS